MKKYFAVLIFLMLSGCVLAAEFSPTLLKLSADPIVGYDFDGSAFEMDVTVSGTNAGLIFAIFTIGMQNTIREVQNGYLGWHYVNKVDTCIYYSPIKNVQMGDNIITWDGSDQDGSIVPAGIYTYYIWAFDNQGAKQPVSNSHAVT